MSSKTRAPEQTFEETKFLRRLVDNRTTVCMKLTDDSEVEGRIEFYDESFIRLTRKDAPNLFIFKHDIKYLYEVPESQNPE